MGKAWRYSDIPNSERGKAVMELGWVELGGGTFYHCHCGQLFDADFMARDGHDVGGCGYDPYDEEGEV